MSNRVHAVVRRSVPCYFCNEFLDERYLSEHVTQCAAILDECPNKCGVYVPRRNLEAHQESCERRLSRQNNQIKDMQDTVWKEKVFSVLTLLRLAIDHGDRERAHLQNALSRNLSLLHAQQESITALRASVMEATDEARVNDISLNQRLSDVEMIMDDTQHCTSLSFQRIAEQLKLFEEELTGGSSKQKQMPNDWLKELKDLKTFIAKEAIRASDMWQEQMQRINDMKLELEMRCKDSKELTIKHDALTALLDSVYKMILKNTEDTAQQKSDIKALKFQTKENFKYIEELITENCKLESSLGLCSCNMETVEYASTNGRIIWRIDRYKEKMSEAKENNCTFRSPLFLHKEYGYTLRMELFMNGKGQWKNRHIIGCLRVESGNWDPLLDWPCVLRATVILRDQENPANDLRKTVKTVGRDKDDSDESDKESDLYMFIPHTTLSRYPGYTKNNVIFLEIRVNDIKANASTTSIVAQ